MAWVKAHSWDCFVAIQAKKASSVNVLRIRAVVPNKGALKRKGVPRLIEPEPFILVNLSL